jgi:hypothetical protein
MLARLFVPNLGSASARVQQETLDDVTELQVRIHKARLVSNNHNEADECELLINYDDAGIDPRLLKSCEVYLHLGDGDAYGDFSATADNLRFIGIATEVEREFDGDKKSIQIKALDYTTLFLECRQLSPRGYPDHSQNLTEAWARICDFTGYFDVSSGQVVSTVQRLKGNLDFVGVDERTTLGGALDDRLAKLGKMQTHPSADAWAVWQTVVGSLGLISFIRGDRCIVTTATDYYTADDPPRMVLGRNVHRISERRDVHQLSAKNVCIQSFNPLRMQTIEAFWPPPGDVKPQKRLGASALGAPEPLKASVYEIFDCPMPITDPRALEDFARRVWEERSRQELRGKLTTVEMFVDTLGGASFDLLKLQAGDRIRVEIDQEALTIIQRLPAVGQRVQALMDRGYSSDMANYLAKNLDGINKLTPEFQVHSVATDIDVTTPPGHFTIDVDFLNRIEVSGSASPGGGEGTDPFTNQTKTVKNPTAERQRNARPTPKINA